MDSSRRDAGEEGGGAAGGERKSVADHREEGPKAVDESVADKKAKKAAAARKRYWASKGLEPPAGDGRSLRALPKKSSPKDAHVAPAAVKPKEGSDDASDEPDSPRAPPLHSNKPPRTPQRQIPRSKKGAGESSGSMNKWLIGGALLAVGYWLTSKSQGSQGPLPPSGGGAIPVPPENREPQTLTGGQ